MKKLKYTVLLFIFCFSFFCGKIYASENNSILPDGTYLREIEGVYYGKKQLDEAKIDASDLYSDGKYWIKQYYKYNFDEFIKKLKQAYYKEYIYQSLYYSIKFEDSQEITSVTDFLGVDMNYAWISQNNELRIYFDSFYNKVEDPISGILTQSWKYDDKSYAFTPQIIHILRGGELIDINFQSYLPQITLENEQEIGIILPDDNNQVVVHFQHQTGSNIINDSFYRYTEQENDVIEKTKDTFTLDVSNKGYDGKILNFIFLGEYDLFLWDEKGKNIFIKSSCNTDDYDYFSWGKEYEYDIKSQNGYDRSQYIKELELEFTLYENGTGSIVEIPYTYSFDGYDRNTMHFSNMPLGLYSYKIKNLKSTHSHICQEIYGITKYDNFEVINSILESEKNIFYQDKIYPYSDDIFEMFSPEWGELNQKTRISMGDFNLSWDYKIFSYIKKIDVTLMNSQKETILEKSCILPEAMTEENIIANIENENYLQNQLDTCKSQIDQELSEYFFSGGKIEFPWISVHYEDIFGVTRSIFSRFEFMPENIPFIVLKNDAFDELGQYFYFNTYNVWYDDELTVSIIDENDDEILIPTYKYPDAPPGDENYFDRDSGDELFIKNTQAFKKIIIKLNDEIVFEKDFSIEKASFQDTDLNYKNKMSLASEYSVDHLFSEKIGQSSDLLFGRKIYIKKLKNVSSDTTGYDIQLSLTGTLLGDIDPTKLYVCSHEVIDITTLGENLDCNNLPDLSERINEEDLPIGDFGDEYITQGVVLYDIREFYIYGLSGLVSPDFQKLSVQFQITTFEVTGEW